MLRHPTGREEDEKESPHLGALSCSFSYRVDLWGLVQESLQWVFEEPPSVWKDNRNSAPDLIPMERFKQPIRVVNSMHSIAIRAKDF